MEEETPKPKEGSADPDRAGMRFSEGTKQVAREESQGKCIFCGKPTTQEKGADQSQIDHAIPRSRGGDDSLPNAQNTCRTCNLRKGTKTTAEFLDKTRKPP